MITSLDVQCPNPRCAAHKRGIGEVPRWIGRHCERIGSVGIYVMPHNVRTAAAKKIAKQLGETFSDDGLELPPDPSAVASPTNRGESWRSSTRNLYRKGRT